MRRTHARRYPAPPRTWHVDPAGNDAAPGTPDRPIATVGRVNALALRPGDRVLFRRGATWTGTKLMPATNGRMGRPLLFGAYGAGAKPVLAGGAAYCAVLLNRQSHVWLDSLELRAGTADAMEVQTGEGITLTNCDFVGGAQSSLTMYGAGIRRVVVQGCTATGSLSSGMEIAGADGGAGILGGLLVEHCTMTGNGNREGMHGLYVKRTWGAMVRYNVCDSNYQSGIKLRFDVPGAMVHHNRCNRNRFGVELNVIPNPAPWRVVVRDNVLQSNQTGNVLIDDEVVGVEVVHNTLINGLYRGIYWTAYAGAGSGCVVRDNLIVQDNAALGAGCAMQIISEAQAARHTFARNLYHVTAGTAIVDRAGASYTWAQWRGLAAHPDADSINANPQLVNAALAVQTTVNADSAAGGTVLRVANSAGFAAQDIVVIGAGTARLEFRKVAAVGVGTLTLATALTYTHTGAQADTVRLGVVVDAGLSTGSPARGTASDGGNIGARNE